MEIAAWFSARRRATFSCCSGEHFGPLRLTRSVGRGYAQCRRTEGLTRRELRIAT